MALVWSFAIPAGYARADEVTAGLAEAHTMMQQGAYVKAIDIITNIIASGKAQADMAAKALLMRGQAREQLGKKAFALADYNQALWMQGLSESDKQLAEAGKARIQGGLGVNEPTRKMVSEVSNSERTSLSSPSISPTASYSPSPSYSSAPPAASFDGGSATPVVATSMRTATLGFDQSPPPQESGSQRRSGGGIGGFFSSLFGGSETSSSPQQETTAVAVVSPQTRTSFQQEQSSRSSRVVSSTPSDDTAWNSRTAQASTASTEPYADNMSGHFAIQFAALLSEDKAIYEVNRVARRYGEALNGRSPSIRIVGTRDGDTLYKIVAGPYETMDESTAKCNELKTIGVQCMVISVK